MTQTFGTSARTNDLYIGQNGNLVILQGEAAVAAAAGTATRASLGEEVLATLSGQPFFQAVFVGVPNLQMFRSSVINTIGSIPGVTQVLSVTTTLSRNQAGKTVLVYEATFMSQYSSTPITISGEIPSP